MSLRNSLMEFLHLRNTHTEPSGGQPRTLTSGPKQNPGRAATPASGPLRNATSFFDGSEEEWEIGKTVTCVKADVHEGVFPLHPDYVEQGIVQDESEGSRK